VFALECRVGVFRPRVGCHWHAGIQPNYAINPDYSASAVLLNDGRILTGTVRSADQKLLIGDKDGKVHEVACDDVQELKHSSLSIMPDGIPQLIGSERMRDLLTFLMTEPPHMPTDAKLVSPRLRTRSKVASVLIGSEPLKQDNRPLRILLLRGIAWSVNEPVDRFDELAKIGVKLAE
jgi:hypothetical protein